MKPVITVLGSLNMDFVVSVERLPAPGQTILGSAFQMLPGGKGANQAFACGRLGADRVQTRMAGRVGYDLFADHLKASLAAANVDVSNVHATRSQPTGVALIWVERSGQNSIVVAPGANHALIPADVSSMRPAFKESRYALFQLETPLDAVIEGLRIARGQGTRTILDPAPAQRLPANLLDLVDILTPNESEACALLDRSPAPIASADAPSVAADLHKHTGVRTVVLKLGAQGCFYSDGEQQIYVPAFEVIAKDTTAAGDTFNGAFAVALAEDKPPAEALRFANAAAALSVMHAGAQASIPSRAAVENLLATSCSAGLP